MTFLSLYLRQEEMNSYTTLLPFLLQILCLSGHALGGHVPTFRPKQGSNQRPLDDTPAIYLKFKLQPWFGFLFSSVFLPMKLLAYLSQNFIPSHVGKQLMDDNLLAIVWYVPIHVV